MPSGYADNSLDCDDTAPEINPAAVEICDQLLGSKTPPVFEFDIPKRSSEVEYLEAVDHWHEAIFDMLHVYVSSTQLLNLLGIHSHCTFKSFRLHELHKYVSSTKPLNLFKIHNHCTFKSFRLHFSPSLFSFQE